MSVLTVTFTLDDSHETMLELLEMNATQVSLPQLANVLEAVINGSMVSSVEVDLDGSPVVTVPK